MNQLLRKMALEFHAQGRPGKIEVVTIKPVRSVHDLTLAYSPGVGAVCEEIASDADKSFDYTAKGNLVGVISNGTAVLGYGHIGPHAAKPVMEGKGILFKRFADIDVFDIEIDETDPDRLAQVVASIAPTFGGINLEDIRAPECFSVERTLRAKLRIPVFHDDQHGTAVVVSAAVINALRMTGRSFQDVRLVCNGAGAAAIACLDMLVAHGMKREHMHVFDSQGHVTESRPDLNTEKRRYAQRRQVTLREALSGADIFLGVSKGNALSGDDIIGMNDSPLILALANPIPEIMPEVVKAVRPDAILCTGRSDFPNQVNNVLCFPYVFRAALDVRATTINTEMLLAAARTLADLAYTCSFEGSRVEGASLKNHLIPGVFDQRLLPHVSAAVASAAIETGVALRPYERRDVYLRRLERLAHTLSGSVEPQGMEDGVLTGHAPMAAA